MKNIVKNICQSDPAALKELWDALAPDVYKLAYSILRSEDDAKEITQMVFIKIWEVRSTLKIEKEIRPFLFTIAKNSSYDVLRKKYKEKVLLGNLQNEFRELTPSELDSDVMERVLFRLEQLIAELPEQRRTIFVSSRFEGLTYKQIAERLNISENTVDTQMRRALNFLRKHLAEEIAMFIISVLSA